MSGGVPVAYDATSFDSQDDRPVLSILLFLSEFGFLEADDVFDAMVWIGSGVHRGVQAPGWPGRRRRRPRRLRRVLRVIRNLRLAAG